MLHECVPDKVNLRIMYDVACNFVQYLKSNDSHLTEKVAFAIPSFHAYGHKPSFKTCLTSNAMIVFLSYDNIIIFRLCMVVCVAIVLDCLVVK